MAMLDDQPLRDDASPGPYVGAARAPGPPLAVIVVGVLLLLAAATGGWWWWRGRPAEPAVAQPAAPVSTAPVAVKTDPTLEVPPLAELDPFIRQLLGALSPRPELARWLATDDLAGHLAAGIAQVAGGATPAKDFASLRPAGKFSVAGRGDRRVIADSSFRRYDGLAATVASVDAASAARAYRILAQRLQEAYAAQGRRGRVDEDVRAGLDRLVDTPVPDGPIAVRPGRGNTWAFADPGLERLSAAQKQLLRMGPDNARAVQQKLREIRDALSTAASP